MKLNEKDKLILKNLGIKVLVLCGSRATNTANEKSDYDFLIIGPKNENTYDTIYDMLSKTINKLTDIDIVFEMQAPLNSDLLIILGADKITQ